MKLWSNNRARFYGLGKAKRHRRQTLKTLVVAKYDIQLEKAPIWRYYLASQRARFHGYEKLGKLEDNSRKSQKSRESKANSKSWGQLKKNPTRWQKFFIIDFGTGIGEWKSCFPYSLPSNLESFWWWFFKFLTNWLKFDVARFCEWWGGKLLKMIFRFFSWPCFNRDEGEGFRRAHKHLFSHIF